MLLKAYTLSILITVNSVIGFINTSIYQESSNCSLKFDIYDVIYLEENFGLKGSYRAKRKFKKIYTEVAGNFELKDSYSQEDVEYFFSLVTRTLEKNHILPSNNYFITPALAEKYSYIDCDNFSLIYISIASRLKLPVSPIYVKNHVFVRWNFQDGSHYNWDGRAKSHREDSYYERAFKVSEQTKKTGLYLSPVSLKRALAPLYVDFSIDKYEQENLPEALAYVNRALLVDSTFINAYFHKAKILESGGDFQSALRAYAMAKSLDSLDTRSYYREGELLIKLGNHTQAVFILEKLLSLDANELDAIPILIDAHLNLHNIDEAKKLYSQLYSIGVMVANRNILDAKSVFKKHGVSIDN